LKCTPFSEKRALANFEASLVKLNVENRYDTWLDMEHELQEFREVRVIAPKKNKNVLGILEQWLKAPVSNYGFDPYLWPCDFERQRLFSIFGAITVLSSESSHWSSPSDLEASEYRCYFSINDFVFCFQADLLYEDVFGTVGTGSPKKELCVPYFQLKFWRTCTNGQFQNIDWVPSMLRTEDAHALFSFDSSDPSANNIETNNIKRLAQYFYPTVPIKLLLHILFIVSVPLGFEVRRFYCAGDMSEPNHISDFWKLLNSSIWIPHFGK